MIDTSIVFNRELVSMIIQPVSFINFHQLLDNPDFKE